MSYLQTYLTGWVGERILADLRMKLFGHLQRLSLGYFERNRAGVIISRLTNDVEALDQLVTDDVVYDLGSGDGRIVIAAARDFGARGVGIEIDPSLVAYSQEQARKAGFEVVAGTPEQLAARIRTEIPSVRELVEKAGIKPE